MARVVTQPIWARGLGEPVVVFLVEINPNGSSCSVRDRCIAWRGGRVTRTVIWKSICWRACYLYPVQGERLKIVQYHELKDADAFSSATGLFITTCLLHIC